MALHNDGNFDGALAEFTASYDAQQVPEVFYNIALSQKALFRYSAAIASFQRYLQRSTSLTAARRAEVTALITDMEALLAPVTIDVDRPEARVAIDGNTVGLTPLSPVQVAAGAHTITVGLDGYLPFEQQITVVAGVAQAVRVALHKVVVTGKVQLSVSPTDAYVQLDKQPVTLPALLELSEGGHSVVATADNFRTLKTELGIVGGQAREVHLTLIPAGKGSHFYDKWYFWVPVVAIVGGALGVGLGLGLPSSSPLGGTLPPGSRKLN